MSDKKDFFKISLIVLTIFLVRPFRRHFQNEFIVVILHSLITHEEQVRALRGPTPGKRMIILATNIAESSITVPDVKYGTIVDPYVKHTAVLESNN